MDCASSQQPTSAGGEHGKPAPSTQRSAAVWWEKGAPPVPQCKLRARLDVKATKTAPTPGEAGAPLAGLRTPEQAALAAHQRGERNPASSFSRILPAGYSPLPCEKLPNP